MEQKLIVKLLSKNSLSGIHTHNNCGQAQLHLISAADRPPNRHTIFVDSEKEKRSLDLAAYFGTHPALLARTANRPRLEDLKAGKFATALNPETVRIFPGQLLRR